MNIDAIGSNALIDREADVLSAIRK